MSSSQQLILGESASNSVNAEYVDDVFSCSLYKGTGAAGNNIVNNIDLSTYGGLVWCKNAQQAVSHALYDTGAGRGVGKYLSSDTNAAQVAAANSLTSFNTDGFTLGVENISNQNNGIFSNWTFRQHQKFFDIQTYSGDGASGRTITHSLGSVPGCIIIKSFNTATTSWAVYHRAMDATSPANYTMFLQLSNARTANINYWQNTAPTSTDFTVGLVNNVNAVGSSYVAYLFAHDAGGFGPSGSDNIISCGSYTGNGSNIGPIVNCGFEPQFLLIKSSTISALWQIYDIQRGLYGSGNEGSSTLYANASNAQDTTLGTANVLPNGFQIRYSGANINTLNATYIYIAIRRPMKPSAVAENLFAPTVYTGTNIDNRNVGDIYSDMVMARNRAANSGGFFLANRMTGNKYLATALTNAEATQTDGFMPATFGSTISGGNSFAIPTGCGVGNNLTTTLNQSATNQLIYQFKRSTGFFDIVQYSGTGATQSINHNLKATPELMIVKDRTTASSWGVYHSALGATQYLLLNTTDVNAFSTTFWGSTAPTASNFTVGTASETNASGDSYICYLFATYAGVSKIGSYSGTGSVQTIDCGFPSGVRFVLIKSTTLTTGWFVWDTARGMTAGTDPRLATNSVAAEANANWIYTTSTGFQIVTSNSSVNSAGNDYIYLAIA